MTVHHCTCVYRRCSFEQQDSSKPYSRIHEIHCPLYINRSLLVHENMLPTLRTVCSNLHSSATGAISSPSTLGMTKIVIKTADESDNDKTDRTMSLEEQILFDWSRLVTTENDQDTDCETTDDDDDEAWWRVLGYPSCPEPGWFGNAHVCKDVRYMYVVWRCLTGNTPLDGHEPFCGGNLLSLFHLSHGVWVCHSRSVANNANNTVLEQMKRIWSSLKRCLFQREQYAELD